MNWTGLYAGAGVGVYAGLSGLEGALPTDELPIPLFNLDKVSSWGFLGDVRLGYDYQFPSSPFVVGVFGGYTWGAAEADLSGIPGLNKASAGLHPTWNVGGRLGFATSRALFYGGYKYSQADLEVSSGQVSKSMDLTGHTILGGIEYAVMKSVTVSLEYGYTRYEDVDMKLNGVDVHAEPEAHSVMLRANLKFGGYRE